MKTKSNGYKFNFIDNQKNSTKSLAVVFPN
jgi:hypothetical protein